MPTNTDILEQTETAVGLDNPSLAVGVGGVFDWSDTMMFIDVMKMTRGWNDFVDGEYRWFDDLKEMDYFGDSLDDNGWPTYMPDHVDNFTTIWDWSEDGQFADTISEQRSGTYVLRYEGEGEVQISGGSHINIISEEAGEIVFENITGGTMFMSINSTDPNGTGDYVREMTMVNQEHVELFEAGAIFHPDYIEAYSELRELRAMDLMETNNSDVSELSDRPMVDDITYMGGAPIEMIVELANQAGTDLWINVPHFATDEYIEFLATYVQENLDPNLKVTVEYSNEIWNTLFQQSSDAHTLGMEAFPDAGDGYDVRLNYQGMRTMETMKIFTEVFGDDGADRLVRVAGSMADNAWVTEQIINAPLWQEADPDNYVPPHTYFDAVAVTTYFGAAIVTNQEYLQTVVDAINDPNVDANDVLRDMLRDPNVESSIPRMADGLQDQANLVEQYDLGLVSYEGGQHVHHLFGTLGDGAQIEEFMRGFVRSEQMGELYEDLIEIWATYGDGPFMNFGWVGAPGSYGSWAAKATYDDTNPRSDILEDYNENNTPDWEDRGGEHFQQGIIENGDDESNLLIGTSQEDFLLGQGGDDLLVGGAGNDGLHGGDGNDSALFSGSRSDYSVMMEGDGYRVIGNDGSDFIVDVEFLDFEDGTRFEVSTMELDTEPMEVPVPEPVDPPVDITPEPTPTDPVAPPVEEEPPVDDGPITIKNYIFGHSLVFNVPTPESGIEDSVGMKVPYWMHEFAAEAGNEYSFSGEYGFFPDATPKAQWGIDGYTPAWDDDSPLTFGEIDFTSVTMTVANFIQYKDSTEPLDGDNPNGNTPVGLTLESIDYVLDQEPGVDVFIYANWADMGGFTQDVNGVFAPTADDMADYHEYTMNDFQDWWDDFVDNLQEERPDANIIMIPVGATISKMLTDTNMTLSEIPVADLYYDDSPHGTDTLYFLASVVNYTYTYGELPPADFEIPETVHNLVGENYDAILDVVWDVYVNGFEAVGDESPVEDEPPVDDTPVGDGPLVEDDIITINGDADDNFFVGSTAAEIIDGMEGSDILSYRNSAEGIFIKLGGDSQSGGDAQGDVLINIDGIMGSDHDDIMFGTDADEALLGGDGDDFLSGAGGKDEIFGGLGNDTFLYASGVMTLFDAEGSDTLIFADNISLDDIVVNDEMSLSFSNQDGSIYFAEGISEIETFYFAGSGVAIESSSLLETEEVVEEDPVIVDEPPVDEACYEDVPADLTENIMNGGAEEDYLMATAQADIIDGGDGYDFSIYLHSEGGVTVNLLNNANNGGYATGDVLTNIEGLVGSNHNDILFGNELDNEINGFDGDDIIIGGAGSDILYGGAGADKFAFNGSSLKDADYIGDFNAEEGDWLDISDLLGGYDPLDDLIADFVQVTSDGSGGTISVDVDGGADNFVQIVQINSDNALNTVEEMVGDGAIII